MRISALKAQKPFSGETLLVKDDDNMEMAKRVIELSRSQYAKKYVIEQSTPPKSKEEKTTRKRNKKAAVKVPGE